MVNCENHCDSDSVSMALPLMTKHNERTSLQSARSHSLAILTSNSREDSQQPDQTTRVKRTFEGV